MHVFVYEWVTGGGMVEHSLGAAASLAEEGATMVRSVVSDFVRMPDVRVTVFRDVQLAALPVRDCEVIDIDSSGMHDEEFDRLAATSDAMLLIAPEFDGVLLSLTRRAETLGARLVSPGTEFVHIASNKRETGSRLSAAGLPVPESRLLEPEEPLPRDFSYPAVVKPIDSCGSQDIYVVNSANERPPSYAWMRRLERFVPGLPASIAILTGPAASSPLPPCRQHLSADGRLRYLGGSLPLSPGLAVRATDLAVAAISAMPSCVGWVGVDLVLGGKPSGEEDAVIEINPRLTTSYVGLRAATEQNLAEQMLRVANNEIADLHFNSRPLEFDTAGTVSFAD